MFPALEALQRYKINPDYIFGRILFEQRNFPNAPDIRWTMHGDFSGDFIAGFIQGLHYCIPLVRKTYPYQGSIFVNIGHVGYIRNYLIEPEGGGFDEHIRDYIIPEYLMRDDWNRYRPDDNKYGWWFNYERNPTRYRLLQFSSPEFIQGFITIMQAFDIDFRNYVLGPPFKVINGKKVAYAIEGYDIDLQLINEPLLRLDDEEGAEDDEEGVEEDED